MIFDIRSESGMISVIVLKWLLTFSLFYLTDVCLIAAGVAQQELAGQVQPLTIFGYCYTVYTVVVSLVALIVLLCKYSHPNGKNGDPDYFILFIVTLVGLALPSAVAAMTVAALQGNMYNFQDGFYLAGIMLCYMIALFIHLATIALVASYNQVKVATWLVSLMVLVTVFVSLLVFGHHNQDLVMSAVGYALLAFFGFASLVVIIYYLSRDKNTSASTVV